MGSSGTLLLTEMKLEMIIESEIRISTITVGHVSLEKKHDFFGLRFSLHSNVIPTPISSDIRRKVIITPVTALFLTRLGFEKIFKTQRVFKIKELFPVMLKYFKYSREKSSTLWGSKNPRNFQKSRDFLGALRGGFTFHGPFLEKKRSNLVNNIEPRRFQWTKE